MNLIPRRYSSLHSVSSNAAAELLRDLYREVPYALNLKSEQDHQEEWLLKYARAAKEDEVLWRALVESMPIPEHSEATFNRFARGDFWVTRAVPFALHAVSCPKCMSLESRLEREQRFAYTRRLALARKIVGKFGDDLGNGTSDVHVRLPGKRRPSILRMMVMTIPAAAALVLAIRAGQLQSVRVQVEPERVRASHTQVAPTPTPQPADQEPPTRATGASSPQTASPSLLRAIDLASDLVTLSHRAHPNVELNLREDPQSDLLQARAMQPFARSDNFDAIRNVLSAAASKALREYAYWHDDPSERAYEAVEECLHRAMEANTMTGQYQPAVFTLGARSNRQSTTRSERLLDIHPRRPK